MPPIKALAKFNRIASPLIFVTMIAVLPQIRIGQEILQMQLRFAILAAALCVLNYWYPAVFLTNRALVAIGKVSFSIYLVHFAFLRPAYDLTAMLIAGRGVLFLVTYYIAIFAPSLAIASMTYRWIEEPCIALGRQITSGYKISLLQSSSVTIERTGIPLR